MKLSDLPPELLRDILNGPQSCGAVITLWKAGDRSLNTKLVNSGVTDVDLVDDRRDSSSCWPQCLKSFRLERLFISCRNPSFCTPDILHELQQLSPALKVLQLFNPGLIKHLLPVGGESKELSYSDESSSTKRPKTTENGEDDVLHTRMWNLGHTWPTLERLDLGDYRDRYIYGCTPTSKLESRVLTLLPQTLTSLFLPWSEIHPLPGMLPHGLKTLHVCPYSLGEDDLHQLPKSITDIMLSVNEYGLALLNQERDLLPNLKQFPIVDLDAQSFALEGLIESMEYLSWPPNMLEMVCYSDDYPRSAFEELPPSMTSLAIRTYYETFLLRASLIQRLPRGLTALRIPNLEWNKVDVSTWPSTLSRLSIQNCALFSADCFHLLPRSLESFYITDTADELGEGEEEAEDEIPLRRDFEALCTIGRTSLSNDTHWTSIKHYLQRRRSFIHEMAMETYIEKVESGQLYGLPLTLVEIKLPQLLRPIEVSLLLPPRLTHFSHN